MSAAVASALAFNLLCTGTASYSSDGSSPEQRSVAMGYIIDLKQNQWCMVMEDVPAAYRSCQQIQPIYRVAPHEIWLQLSKDPSDPKNHIITKLDRTTGGLVQDSQTALGHSFISAMCVKKPFTGFPANKF